MVVKMKENCNKSDIQRVIERAAKFNCEVFESKMEDVSVLHIHGDTGTFKMQQFEELHNVENVFRIQEAFKIANRKSHPSDTVVSVGNLNIGGGNFVVMAGPCSVESENQIIEVAESVKNSGAQVLRGGAFKPRTSPYAFQGMGLDGLELLKKAKSKTGLPIVTEIMSVDMIDTFVNEVDIIQVGARNMQNFHLLKELGKTNKAILLKRGMSATIQEFIMSAEYIMSEGNHNIILCERGIRTFETFTRNTLDLSAIPAIKELTHLPIIVDPSHATGKRSMVDSLSKAAAAVGADGLMIEVHNDPENALCDGPQSLRPEEFEAVMRGIEQILPIVSKKFS